MSALRGFVGWEPKAETIAVIEAVAQVIEEYRDYLPISLRQIFYRLVAEHGYEKTESAYNRLGTHVARARRAQMLPFDAITDAQGRPTEPLNWRSPDAFWEGVFKDAERFRLDRMEGQSVRIEVWSEAGMTDMLFRVAAAYGISVYSSRGFASVTNSHNVAERALAAGKPTVLLHVGDFDPSGVSIFKSLTEDARSFLIQKRAWAEPDFAEDGRLPFAKMDASGVTIRPVRVALTEDQVAEFNVETAPPKASDSRSASWVGETAQAEALPPDLMSKILQGAIERELDLDLYEGLLERERVQRDALVERVERVVAA